MPSKLPIIKANTSQENIDKMKVIAQENKRSVAKELEFLIEQRIKQYEDEHGEINVEKLKQQEFDSAIQKMGDSLYDMIVMLAKTTRKTTREMWEDYLKKAPEKKKSKSDFVMIQKYVEQRISEAENE